MQGPDVILLGISQNVKKVDNMVGIHVVAKNINVKCALLTEL